MTTTGGGAATVVDRLGEAGVATVPASDALAGWLAERLFSGTREGRGRHAQGLDLGRRHADHISRRILRPILRRLVERYVAEPPPRTVWLAVRPLGLTIGALAFMFGPALSVP